MEGTTTGFVLLSFALLAANYVLLSFHARPYFASTRSAAIPTLLAILVLSLLYCLLMGLTLLIQGRASFCAVQSCCVDWKVTARGLFAAELVLNVVLGLSLRWKPNRENLDKVLESRKKVLEILPLSPSGSGTLDQLHNEEYKELLDALGTLEARAQELKTRMQLDHDRRLMGEWENSAGYLLKRFDSAPAHMIREIALKEMTKLDSLRSERIR